MKIKSGNFITQQDEIESQALRMADLERQGHLITQGMYRESKSNSEQLYQLLSEKHALERNIAGETARVNQIELVLRALVLQEEKRNNGN